MHISQMLIKIKFTDLYQKLLVIQVIKTFNAPVNVMRGDRQPWDSHERHFYSLRILTWPYQVILSLGNSNIEFCNKSGNKSWGTWGILTSKHDSWGGFWHIFSVSESQGMPILPSLGCHIDWCRNDSTCDSCHLPAPPHSLCSACCI